MITQWSKQWLVSINSLKTKVLYFGNGQPPNLVFDDTILTTTESNEHFGLTRSTDCKWSRYFDNITDSSSKMIRILRKFKYFVR